MIRPVPIRHGASVQEGFWRRPLTLRQGLVPWLVVAVVLLGCDVTMNLGDACSCPDASAKDDVASQDDASSKDAGSKDANSVHDASADANRPDVTKDAPHEVADATNDAAPRVLRLFVTRSEQTGKFGGLAGADEICTGSGNSRWPSTRWRAWLSDSNTDARDRIEGNGPWVEPDTGTVIFPNASALRGVPSAPIVRDQFGEIGSDRWWTGTRMGGVRAWEYCADWTHDYGTMRYGTMGSRNSNTDIPGGEWTDRGLSQCSAPRALVCLEQP